MIVVAMYIVVQVHQMAINALLHLVLSVVEVLIAIVYQLLQPCGFLIEVHALGNDNLFGSLFGGKDMRMDELLNMF